MMPYSENLLQNWRVVVVEDDLDSLELARYILEFYGAEVSTAENGLEGLQMIRRVRPNFIISDLSMPKMDGWELIRHIKEDVALQDIPIIALTAHAMSGDRERAIAAGFHNHLTKPLTVDTFMQQLVALLMDMPVIGGVKLNL